MGFFHGDSCDVTGSVQIKKGEKRERVVSAEKTGCSPESGGFFSYFYCFKKGELRVALALHKIGGLTGDSLKKEWFK